MAQLSNLIVTGVSRLLGKLHVNDTVTAPTFVGNLVGNVDGTVGKVVLDKDYTNVADTSNTNTMSQFLYVLDIGSLYYIRVICKQSDGNVESCALYAGAEIKGSKPAKPAKLGEANTAIKITALQNPNASWVYGIGVSFPGSSTFNYHVTITKLT